MTDYGATDRVRTFASVQFVQPARRQHARTFQIHSGTLAKSLVADKMLAPNRYPLVCNALRSRKFLEENRIRLVEEKTSAGSGLSSDVTFVYSLEGGEQAPGSSARIASFEKLRGLLKRAYLEAGGAERVIQAERDAWDR